MTEVRWTKVKVEAPPIGELVWFRSVLHNRPDGEVGVINDIQRTQSGYIQYTARNGVKRWADEWRFPGESGS